MAMRVKPKPRRVVLEVEVVRGGPFDGMKFLLATMLWPRYGTDEPGFLDILPGTLDLSATGSREVAEKQLPRR